MVLLLLSTKPKLSVMLISGNLFLNYLDTKGALPFHWTMRNTDAIQELIEILLRLFLKYFTVLLQC